MQLLTWGIVVINWFQIKYGTGRHMNDQPATVRTFLYLSTRGILMMVVDTSRADGIPRGDPQVLVCLSDGIFG